MGFYLVSELFGVVHQTVRLSSVLDSLAVSLLSLLKIVQLFESIY